MERKGFWKIEAKNNYETCEVLGFGEISMQEEGIEHKPASCCSEAGIGYIWWYSGLTSSYVLRRKHVIPRIKLGLIAYKANLYAMAQKNVFCMLSIFLLLQFDIKLSVLVLS